MIWQRSFALPWVVAIGHFLSGTDLVQGMSFGELRLVQMHGQLVHHVRSVLVVRPLVQEVLCDQLVEHCLVSQVSVLETVTLGGHSLLQIVVANRFLIVYVNQVVLGLHVVVV